MKLLVKVIFLAGFLIAFSTGHANAANLLNASDTITTSRPSPSSPISANAAAGVGQLSVFNNGSRYLASDSAKVVRGTGIISNTEILASQSALLTSVYLADTLGTGVGAGADVLFVPITAMHTIAFTTVTAIPAGGKVVINFPGSADNSASPSATSFAFNNLNFSGTWTSSLVKTNNITCNDSSTISSPTITCITTAGVSAGTAITFLIGCSSAAGATCSTQAPSLINPTKSATAGTADIWKIQAQTMDGSNVILDDSTLVIGSIESVTLRANIDPSLTFTITGVGNGSAVNNGNTTGCLQTETTNTGIAATSTEANLGTLANSPTATDTKVGNIAAQLITVSTNAGNGYVLTATSSGHLRNPSTGYFLTDNTTPATFPSTGANFFGMHGCGLDTYTAGVGASFWNTTASDTACNSYISGSTGNICKYGWPTQVGAITIASDTTGPIGNSLVAGNGLTSVSYAAGADAGVPPGQYTTIITYVATPSF